MKINHNINTSIITDDNTWVTEQLKGEVIIKDLEQLKTVKTNFIVFDDALRTLSQKEKERFFNNMEERNINFVNITSNLEETLYAHELIVISNEQVVVQGSTISVLKEEKLLKRLGYRLPFVVDLSLQLNSYDIIDSIFLDEELLVNKLW
ncbi:MAG: hypothetical protein E7164_01305 [Firmicutes bacterium]|nr:hypothetical protein [Bacillota bacterium]